jgi:hypothetical protein
MLDLIKETCTHFGSRFTFTAYGFGKESVTFEALQAMVAAVERTPVNTFFATGFSDTSLQQAFSSALTSLASTRAGLTSLPVGFSSS